MKEGYYIIIYQNEQTVGHLKKTIWNKYVWYLIGTDEEIANDAVKIIKQINMENNKGNIWQGYQFIDGVDCNKDAFIYLLEQNDTLALLTYSKLETEIFPTKYKNYNKYILQILRPSIDINDRTNIFAVIEKGINPFPVDIVTANEKIKVSPIKNVSEEEFINACHEFLIKPKVKDFIQQLYQETLNYEPKNS